MDNYQGDLTDILRASGGAAAMPQESSIGGDWQFSSNPENHRMNFSSSIEVSTQENFGDPFSNMQDPLLNELDIACPSFFNSSNTSEIMSTTIFDDEMKKVLPPSPSNNMFSQMIISQNPTLSNPSISVMATSSSSSPRGINHPVVVSRDMINANSSKGCLADNTGLQISSPRNPGIKRRKSQAKKVVCIPAPASANGRPGGDIVPSDLWAWRKYGQKPIKGSPYPRGYYRCSSSKGCSARKQVERSRTDPNMLVITYTSEHNHPWPTQRNALAGSTRSHASKNSTTNSKTSTSSLTRNTTATTTKEEGSINNFDSVVGSSYVKDETTEDIEKQIMDMDDAEFGEDFSHASYIPTMTDSSNSQDFFANLGELEGDPLSALFSQSFTGSYQQLHKENKADHIDPLSSLFDWSGEKHKSNHNNNNTSFGGS